ncbi:MAG: hypothetical protein ACREBJ_11925 [Nitrosotalea sp.]
MSIQLDVRIIFYDDPLLNFQGNGLKTKILLTQEKLEGKDNNFE